MFSFTEDTFEQAVIELFENMGYTHIYAPDMDRTDYSRPLLDDVLRDCLVRLNRNLPVTAIDEAILKLNDFDAGSLLQKNMVFMDYLQNGITVKYAVNGEERSSVVRLIDYADAAKNDFYVVNQYTFVENGNNRRPDIILFINGMPLVLMELKSPSKDEVGAENAYNQIRNYMQDIPSMFYYNAICVISDLSTNKAGTITSGLDRFMEWKTKDGDYENTAYAQFDTFYEGMFQKERLLDILKNFILFSGDGQKQFKILAGYHQYFAVRKAIEKAKIATKTDGKGGVFWHTQGSGKSLSMVFYAHLLQEALDSPTIVVMTDRIDLDDQLYTQFAKCAPFLRQTPVQATSKENLRELLDGRQANGIIFTTMFKFERGERPLSERRNIVVMADEAHRGQYGFDEKIVVKENEQGEKEAHTVVGNARIIHDALPNATYIGFTGTPISAKDRNTREVFGDYIDIYDMTQAVEDGATRPVYYESRVIKLHLDKDTLALIDATYDALEQQSDAATIEKSKKMLGQMESVLGADSTIQSLCEDIVDHYEKYRANLLTGKAMIVAYSRPIAMKIYRKLLELRPAWKEKIGVVMTSGNNDPEDWKAIIGTKSQPPGAGTMKRRSGSCSRSFRRRRRRRCWSRSTGDRRTAMDDLEEKIQAVLNDPQQMQEIFSLARSLGLELPAEGGPPDGKAPEPPKDMPPQAGMPLPGGMSAPVTQLLEQAGKLEKKQENLLNALKPFLKPARREKIDRAMQAARLSHLAGYALKSRGEKHGP